MFRIQRDVQEFHEAMDQVVGDMPAIRDPELRARLIMSEAAETANALLGEPVHFSIGDGPMKTKDDCKEPNLVEVIDGICDVLYVAVGTAVAGGYDLFPFWKIVHASNMAKKDGPVRDDGKRMKPEGWKEPDIAGALWRMNLAQSLAKKIRQEQEARNSDWSANFNLARFEKLFAGVLVAIDVLPNEEQLARLNNLLESFGLPVFTPEDLKNL